MRVNSIFNSIDGEVNYYGQGLLTTFIRLQGCNLKCSYCDTPQAQITNEGFRMTPLEILKKVKAQGVQKLTITGGEPLTQRKELIRFLGLVNRDSKYNCRVTVETNGSKAIPDKISDLASWVVDYKLPSSGMELAMNPEAFECLNDDDVVKFVIADKKDFDAALVFIEETWSDPKGWNEIYPTFAFSPVTKKAGKKSKPIVTPQRLMSWLYETRIPKLYKTALNIQLHKIIGLP